MRRTTRTLSFAAGALLALGARAAHAQKIEGSAALKARAKVTADSAMKIARARVPNGTIRAGEIEMEHGKLIYTFEMKVAGRSGIEEVNVDAITGAVVAQEHESDATVAAEAKAEKAEKAEKAAKAAKAAKRGAKQTP